MKIKALIITAFVSLSQWGYSQGFVNLNFENAVIETIGSPPFNTIASNAIPGWTAYINGGAQQYIVHNDITLSAAAVILQGTNSYDPVQGKYSIWLLGSRFTTPASAAIGQTGQIPLSTLSLIFWGSIGGMQITFNNQTLAFINLGVTGSYNIYGADISPYAGQTGELRFYAPFNTAGIIDNIQFSTVAVPEPTSLSLLGLAGFGFWVGQNRWRSGRRVR